MKGRTAFITGAGRGIGAALAERFRQEGAQVIAPSREEMDLASQASVLAYLERFREPVDILVNNAGINHLGALNEVSDQDFAETLQVNTTSPFLLARALAPGMKARGFGRILNISSIWSGLSKPRRLSYSTSKAAINGLTRALAVELGPSGVLVNALAPGFVDTELTRKNNSPDQLAAIAGSLPLGRLAAPEEIAEMACFLCSSRNTYLTGQVVVLDGGFSIQ